MKIFWENGLLCEDRRNVCHNTKHIQLGFNKFYCLYCSKQNDAFEFNLNDMRVECDCDAAKFELAAKARLDKAIEANKEEINKIAYKYEFDSLRARYGIKTEDI